MKYQVAILGLVEYLLYSSLYLNPLLGCESSSEPEVVYIEVEEVVPEEPAPIKEDEGVDYYFEYRKEKAEE